MPETTIFKAATDKPNWLRIGGVILVVSIPLTLLAGYSALGAWTIPAVIITAILTGGQIRKAIR